MVVLEQEAQGGEKMKSKDSAEAPRTFGWQTSLASPILNVPP